MERQDFDRVVQSYIQGNDRPPTPEEALAAFAKSLVTLPSERKWEYKYIEKKMGANNLEFTNFLNVLGNDGWELVNYQIEQRSYSCSNKYHACIFKRLKL